MKKSILLYLCLQVFFSVLSQENLVPNGNFDANPGNYHGGMNPIDHYTQNSNCILGRQTFEDEISNWKVAETNASISELNQVDNIFTRRCSPDWMGPGSLDQQTTCYEPEQTFYVSSGYIKESIMVELKDGYTLVKGRSYKFRIKVRFPTHAGSFQVVFSAKEEGLNCAPKWRWVAVDTYLGQSCEWSYIESYFTVPTDGDKEYEDMKYLVLQYNNDHMGDARFPIHYDDVFLAEGQKCEDIKYIQDWQYVNTNKIEQANVEIRAGAHVSPYSWPANNPVVVKSSAMVIYRAPTVYLEPGFFIEEAGSYFETQVGTCVEDPCPGVPSFTPPPVAQCTGSFTLGNDFPETPGVFYVWEPANYFSAPWSRVTDVRRPPNDDGCVDAKLTIWTICGAAQVHNFRLQFIDAAPTIDIANVTMSETGISGYINLQNTSEYTIQGINTVTGAVVFEDEYEWDCQNGSQHIPFAVNHCTGNLCQNLEIKITASNPCFGSVSESLQWQAPNVPDYDLQVSNLVSNDFEFNFDWAIPNTYDYVKIQVWNEAKTQKICEWIYNRCSNPINTDNPFHFDIRDCLGDVCFAQCKNYKVVLETKQFCNSLISTKQIAWDKSNTTFAMPVNYPNIITADDDGINDDLCFSPTGADWYDIVIKNRWGNVMHEEQGCVDQIPICMWHPPTNTTDGEYFYTIVFGNQCNYSDELTASVLVLGDNSNLAQNNNPQEHQNSGYTLVVDQYANQTAVARENNSSTWNVSAYPNPAEDAVFIQSSEEITRIILRDVFGKEIVSKEIHDRNTSITISNYASGYYILDVSSSSGVKSINIVKR
jgi:hypothetical protein